MQLALQRAIMSTLRQLLAESDGRTCILEGWSEMATADQVKALVRSHAEGDDTKFYSVALQVAARAARGGRNHFAQELRDLVDALRKVSPSAGRPIPVNQPRGEIVWLVVSLLSRDSDGRSRPRTERA